MLRLSRFSSSSASTPFDICIIGGGIVGSCLASDLGIDSWLSDGIGLFSQGRLRIALIDSNNLHAELSPNQYSNRVSSITPSSAKYLDCKPMDNDSYCSPSCMEKYSP
jgi:2-polyprenyl-6-methoxyphenol hydroxylase-like FAD-dependent oxidoreductase